MRKSTSARAFAIAAAAAAAATAAALEPLQFVAGWPIEVPAEAQVFDVPLTAEIYAGAESIEQLAVLDANGEPQAFFRPQPLPAQPAEQRVVLEASPLYAGAAAPGARIGVTTDERRTAVTVTPGAASEPAVTGFVLDARAAGIVPDALELRWRPLPQPFLLDVTIEQSVDLTSWRFVGRGSVAALTIGDAEVVHARVPVRASAGGYYRVTPRGPVADWHLLRAALLRAAPEPAPPRSARVAPLAASTVPDDAPPEALYFDAGGALPVRSVTLAFPRGDGWARADVAAARSLDGPWTTVAYGALFYRLSFEGQELTSPPLELGRQERRYWRLVPAAPPRGAVELVLAYPEERLRVAPTGAAPYLLAAGTLAEEAGPDPTLASVWSSLPPATERVAPATLGARRELGGPAALVPEWRFPWRTAALWTALVAGVLVALTMAVRLAREMGRQST